MIEKMDLIGGTCPAPVVSQVHDGHYQTFLEMLRTQEMENLSQSPTKNIVKTLRFGVCPYGCSYALFSELDRKRHFILMDHEIIRPMNTELSGPKKKSKK